ncbi:plasmid replication protein RepC (plasmid) [Aureimonas ureilytica]|uniref:plasmid replication protein RepC n=1 Tax=Aureimonas ureilytica TaxID=401562 RepID=UPI003CFB28B4
MIELHWNSPFGARPISAALMRREDGVRRAQARLRARKPETDDASGEGPDKWALLRALTEARQAFGLSDRTLAVLEALLSCHTPKRLDPTQPQIVFPSNRELSLRTRGMADATLRRHLASLVEAGLVLRRDSPNGKRYRRRDLEEGDEAFGFDLSPFALSADLILEKAEEARAEARAARRVRTEIALCRRDIRKILDAALIEERAGDWASLEASWRGVAARLPRAASSMDLAPALTEALALRTLCETLYLSTLSEQEVSGNDAQNERHYQNSKPDSSFEQSFEKKREDQLGAACSDLSDPPRGGEPRAGGDESPGPTALGSPSDRKGAATRSEADAAARRQKAEREAPDIETVLSICPTLSDYSREPIRTLGDFEKTADLVRGALGISADAYRAAQGAMGRYEAAITIAALLERSDRVRSPGGYLRALTAKASGRGFRVQPMLEAIRNQALRS